MANGAREKPTAGKNTAAATRKNHPKKAVLPCCHRDERQTAGPHARGGSQGSLRCGRDEVAVRRGTRSPRGVFQLPLLVFSYHCRLSRPQHLRATERPARINLRRCVPLVVSGGCRVRTR